MRTGALWAGAISVAALLWWLATAPGAHMVIAPSVGMATPAQIESVSDHEGRLGGLVQRIPNALPGIDDIVVLADGNNALATGIDGWIWHMDLLSGKAERFADAPLMAAGLHEAPGQPDQMYLCASHLMGAEYQESEAVGLYRLDIRTGTFASIVLVVPSDGPPLSGREGDAVVYADEAAAPEIAQAMDGAGVRPLAFCNDLEVSDDGRRIYFTEPFAYEGASMGGGAIGEAITLAGNGRLWRHDLETGKTRLIAQGFNFIDGILVEPAADGGREESVLVSQTTSFAITRFYLAGDRAGRFERVWQGLPAMPDGLDRDSQGRIWSGGIKCRSGTTTWIHANAWIKPLLLRLPLDMIPVPDCTGIMVFSPDASQALYFGTIVDPQLNAIASAIEHDGWIYLANFDPRHRGLLRVRSTDILQ